MNRTGFYAHRDEGGEGPQASGQTAWIPQDDYRRQGKRIYHESIRRLAHAHGVPLEFIRPGKPVENAVIGSFNGRFRDECLNTQVFISLVAA